jgi:hypothetical protein
LLCDERQAPAQALDDQHLPHALLHTARLRGFNSGWVKPPFIHRGSRSC